MSGTSLAFKIGSLVLGLGAYFVLFKKVKGLKKYGLSSLFYVLAASIILSLSTLFLLFKTSTGEITSLIFGQIIILTVGTLHVFFAKKLLPWYGEQKFGMQLVFIICTLLFGYFFSNLSLSFIVNSDIEFVWYLSLLWFLVPVLLDRTIAELLEVPPKKYKKWQYPVDVTIEDPTDEEMENPVVISFVFQKNALASEDTTFRAKAPQEMTLGRLFYFFIDDYNSRHPEAPISIVDENKQPDEWVFFKIKNKFLRLKKALDPDDSIFSSRIKENDVLICTRVSMNENFSKDEATE